MTSLRGARIIFLLVGILAGCSLLRPQSAPPQACTLMGCQDSLTVTMSGRVPPEFTMELAQRNGRTIIVHCKDGSNVESGDQGAAFCTADGAIFFASPDIGSVTISWEGGGIDSEIAPVYSVLQPNGPGCPPTCRTAEVGIPIP